MPMAATLTQERFTGPEWVFERKFDGIRLLAFKRGREVQLLSRNRLPQACPPIAQAVAALPVRELILDGEATWGRSMTYHVFDIMWLDGRDVTSLPLDERRILLRTLPLRSPLQHVEPLDDPQPWERACREGWEGVIAKRRDSRYEQRRSPHWLKMKCEVRQAFVVGGFTDPQGTRVGLGALLVGYYEQDEFVFAGKIGTGFDTQAAARSPIAARCDRNRPAAVHQGGRPSAAPRALGAAAHRGRDRVHRVDGSWQAPPSPAARRAP